jgi:hypothetical protein
MGADRNPELATSPTRVFHILMISLGLLVIFAVYMGSPYQETNNLLESVHFVERLTIREITPNMTESEEQIINPNRFGIIRIHDYER